MAQINSSLTVCPNCTFRNLAEANYCQNCGQALNQCPNCGTGNGPLARYCQNCSYELREPLLAEASASIQTNTGSVISLEQYIPSDFLEKLTSARARGGMAGERRVVTMLFCDVVSSTALAEQLDPEEWTEIMNSAFPHLIAPVYRYEGTVASLLGDGLLAFFGAPIAHEDDAQRAVLAALAILDELPALRATIRAIYALDFDVRIGINTGLVVVGEVGSDMRLEYTAMGDAVNLAARMQQAAEPGSILITQYTYRLVAPYFEWEALGPMEVKGKREPVHVYRVLARKPEVAQARGIPGLHAPLVAREREINKLLAAAENLKLGRGSIICLIAEAGLGKTRLIEELRARLAEEQATEQDKLILWSESRGLSYETMRPYGQFQQQIRSVCGIRPNDSPEVIRERIATTLQSIQRDQTLLQPESPFPVERIQRILTLLLGIQEEEAIEQLELQGTDFGRELLDVVTEFWRSLARRQPVILVFDDLHWADASSVELLEHLFQLTDECPVSMLCAFRMHRSAPAWHIRHVADTYFPHRYTELILNPLTTDESAALVDYLISAPQLPQYMKQLIMGKSEGNPFFVEEVVRELIDQNVLVRRAENGAESWQVVEHIENIPVPNTLQALLTARIDRLDENSRRTLQMAAVIGRNFTAGVLRLVLEVPHEIDMHLAQLQRAGLIQEVSRLPEPEYNFRHALIQEAAYNSILLKQRRAFHRRVGETLERIYGDGGDELAPSLAHHFYHAGDLQRATDYFCYAGDRAARLYANAEAVGHYSQAIEIEYRLQMPDHEHVLDLHRKRGQGNEILGRFEEARADYLAQLELARTVGNTRANWHALLNLGFLWASRDYAQAGDYFHQALDLARELNDPAILAQSLNRVGNWHANNGLLQIARQYHQEALVLMEGLYDKAGLAETLDLLALSAGVAGDLILSKKYYSKAIALFRELDNRRGLASSLATLANLFATYELSEMYGIAFHYKDAVLQAEEAAQIARSIGWRAGEAYALLTLAKSVEAADEYDRARTLLEEALALAEQIMHHQWTGAVHWALGSFLFNALHLAEAREHFEEALALAEATHSHIWTSITSGLLGATLILQGELDEAENILHKIYKADQLPQTVGQRLVWFAVAEWRLARGEAEQALSIAEQLKGWLSKTQTYHLDLPLGLRILEGRIFRALGQADAAKAEFEAALEIGMKLLHRSKLWRIYAEFGRLYQTMGNDEDAEREFVTARTLATEMAELMPVDLRERFLRSAMAIIAEDNLSSPTLS